MNYIPYYAYAESCHEFKVGEPVVIAHGLHPDITFTKGTVVNVTKRKIVVEFNDGNFRTYSTRNDNREYGSGRSILSLQYTSYIIGHPKELP